MKIFRNKKRLGIFVCLLCLCMLLGASVADAAIKDFDENINDYDVWVEDLPDGITHVEYIYAKFNEEREDVDNYLMSFFDDYSSRRIVMNALGNEGIDADDYEVFAMDCLLYEADAMDPEEYYPVEESIIMTIICPLPDSMMEKSERVMVVASDGEGGLDFVDYSLVSMNGVTCAKFTLRYFGVHAFIMNTKEVVPTPTPTRIPLPTPSPVPTKKPATPTPTKAPVATPTSAPVPTKVPATPTPSPVPTKAPATPTPIPTPTKAPATPTPIPTPTKVPATPTPSPSPTPSGFYTDNDDIKDDTPSTGDTYQPLVVTVVALVAAVAFTASVRKLRKQSR